MLEAVEGVCYVLELLEVVFYVFEVLHAYLRRLFRNIFSRKGY